MTDDEVICIEDDTASENTTTVGYHNSECLIKAECYSTTIARKRKRGLKEKELSPTIIDVDCPLLEKHSGRSTVSYRSLYIPPTCDSYQTRNTNTTTASLTKSNQNVDVFASDDTAIIRYGKGKSKPFTAIQHTVKSPTDAHLQHGTSAAQFISLPSKMYSIQLPSWWSQIHYSSNSFKIVKLAKESPEAVVVLSAFQPKKITVKTISRIESPSLWRHYISEVNIISEERGESYEQNERLLFHCTKANKSVICTQGLDVRLSNQGNFGRGIYFR